MKVGLIILNLFLVCYLLWSVASNVRPAAPAVEYQLVKPDPGRKSAASARGTSGNPDAWRVDADNIVGNNIFDPARCPNATFARGRDSRVEMTLVGTFQIASCVGAVILQKNAERSREGFPFGGMGLMGGPPGGGMPGGMPGGGMPGMPPGGMPPGGPGMMGGAAAGNPSRGNNGSRSRNRGNFRSRFGTAQNNGQPGGESETTAQVYKQYVRLGETMDNGYTLSEVERDRVVLTRGSEKLELELVEASKGVQPATASSGASSNANPVQQLERMQRFQMMSQFRMMQMMERSMRNQGGGNQTGNRGGNQGNAGVPGGPPGGGGPGGGRR